MKLSDFKVGMKVRFIKHNEPSYQDFKFNVGDIIDVVRVNSGRIDLFNPRTNDSNYGIPLGSKDTPIFLDQFEPVRKCLMDLIMR